jgi:hypothetical protein
MRHHIDEVVAFATPFLWKPDYGVAFATPGVQNGISGGFKALQKFFNISRFSRIGVFFLPDFTVL